MEKGPPSKSISFNDRFGIQQREEKSVLLNKSSSFIIQWDKQGCVQPQRTLSSINDVWKLHANQVNINNERDNIDGDLSQFNTYSPTLEEISREMDTLIHSLNHQSNDYVHIPTSVETFTKMVQSILDKYNNSTNSPTKFEHDVEQDNTFFNVISQLSMLTNSFNKCCPKEQISPSLSTLTSNVLQRAMTLLEEEFRILLEYSLLSPSSNPNLSSEYNQKEDEIPSFNKNHHQSTIDEDVDINKNYPGDINEANIRTLRKIASTMISAGYETECCQVYSILRTNAFKQKMQQLGLEEVTMNDANKLPWETLEIHIISWIHVVKQVSHVLLPNEKRLCHAIFSPEHSSVAESLHSNLARSVVIIFLNFAEAIAITKCSAECLFKVLDIYETITELMVALEASFGVSGCGNEVYSEISSVRCRLGEVVVCIFSDLKNSIKNDITKSLVPGGAVHPLTRYTINYIRYACDFKKTLEQVFSLHYDTDRKCFDDKHLHNSVNVDKSITGAAKATPFTNEIISIMGLLDSNLDAKSKLYKDISLRYIFLMNNGRYILQKIKESPELHKVIGDNTKRRRSTELRGFHKNYQRETWSRVLQCLNQEGLQVQGKVQKALLKERFKRFNQIMDEIHKTQSLWVVSDEQLQSELRVSISAVMIPAYRSFLASFGQHFTPRKHSDKYIKYQPDDIESIIESLFDGNQYLSMSRRKN